MKTIVFLTALSLILFSCNNVSDQDFKDVSKDMCDCMSIFTDELSPEMRQIMVDTDGDEAKFQEALMEYMTENPAEGMKDAQALTKAESPEVINCIEGLEKKYENLYTTMSEDEVVAKVIDELDGMDGCDVTVSVMKMGVNAQK